MSNTSWNPPTGPPNGAPVRPADARHEIDDAIDAARARDRDLRAEVVAVATARVQASDRLALAADEAAGAVSLAKRALTRSNESARAGQRADAAKWTAAAQVFAMRLRDARAEVAALEGRLVAASEQAQRSDRALAENVGRLQAVVAARLPMLSGRKAGRVQREVDDVVSVLRAPTADLVAQATAAARTAAASEAAAESGAGVAPVSDDDLESEVDFESADAILAELRTELGLPAPTAVGSADPADPAGSAGPAPSDQPPASVPAAGGRGPTPASKAKGKGKGTPTSGRSWPVPAARR